MLVRAPRDQEIPASFAQEVFWRWEERYPRRHTWNTPQSFRLLGKLDLTALEGALVEIVRRHESLRTTLSMVNGRLVQIIHPSRRFSLEHTDLSSVPDTERAKEADRLATEAASRVFDLPTELMRAVVLKLGAEEHRIIVVVHHFAWDAMCQVPFFSELSALYDAFSEGKPSPLPELAVQYADWAVSQRLAATGPTFDRQLSYWRSKLAGLQPNELPTDRPRPDLLSLDSVEHMFVLAGERFQALDKLSREEALPRSMAVMAAISVLMHTYARSNDVALCLTSAYRPKPELAKLIGLFLNHQILRVTLPEDTTFRGLMRIVSHAIGEAQANRDVPAAMAQDCPGAGLESPLDRVKVNVRPARVARAQPSLRGLDVARQPLTWPIHQRGDLVFLVREGVGDLGIGLMGAADLFDKTTVVQLADDLKAILDKILLGSDELVSKIAPTRIGSR